MVVPLSMEEVTEKKHLKLFCSYIYINIYMLYTYLMLVSCGANFLTFVKHHLTCLSTVFAYQLEPSMTNRV